MGLYTVTVVGATGKTGRHIVRGGLGRGWRMRAAARREPVVGEWAHFEWDDRGTWGPAFAGSDAGYLLIPFNHPGAAEATPDLIAAAAQAGLSRLALLSSLDAEHAPPDSSLIRAEQRLLEQPVVPAILRPTWFFDNFSEGSFRGMVADGEIRLPAGDGKFPFIDVRDIGEVAVAALAADGPHGILPLTGPEAIDHRELAAALTVVLGRSVTYTSVSIPEFVEIMVGRGFGRDYAKFLGGALMDVAEGRLTIQVHRTVERILGRPALDASDFAAQLAPPEAGCATLK
jgi:uncharacterized protein YbjT (DUF2867 family)